MAVKKIRVLALNDDNHETSFHSEWNKTPWHNHMDFIKHLAKSHDWEYEIRCVYLVDMEASDFDKAERAFDLVQSPGKASLLDYLLAFETLWECSTETMFGGY